MKPQSTGGIVVQLCGKALINDPQDYLGWRADWIEGHPSSLRRLRHIVCVVRNMRAALVFFLHVLAGELVADEPIVLPQRARQATVLVGGTKLALIAADDLNTGPLGAYFSRPASGVYALVWEVDDLIAARTHMQGLDLPLIPSEFDKEGFAIHPVAMLGARHEFVLAS